MRFLLIIPRIVNKPGDYYLFPLGFAYIAAAMAEAGIDFIRINLNHVEGRIDGIVDGCIRAEGIDAVLTGGLTGQYGAIRNVIDAVKRQHPRCICIVGGGIITSAPVLSMQALEVADIGVIGEGENTVPLLCQTLARGADPHAVPGIVVADDHGFSMTEGNVPTVDVDAIPVPDYDGLGMDELLSMVPNIVGMNDYNTFPILTSRGCPYSCTFCFHPSGVRYRQRDLDLVFEEIDGVLERYPIRFISIQDELFGHDFDRVREFCRRIAAYDMKWWAQFRVKDLTEDLLALLKESGCVSIGLGIESADDRILRSMRKQITVADTEDALRLVNEAGIGVQGCLIFGDVAETRETAENSIEWWKRHLHFGLQLSLIVTYPGTQLFRHATKSGLIEDPVQYIRDSCPTIKLSGMSDDDYRWLMEQLLALQRVEEMLPIVVRQKLNPDTADMDIDAECCSCRGVNRWQRIPLFIAESLICEHCGRRHYSPVIDDVVRLVDEGIRAMLKTGAGVAMWGVNSYFYALCAKLALVTDDRVYFVDQSEIRQGVGMLPGKRIETPSIIDEMKVDTVIVAVPQYYASLEPYIRGRFPGVRQITHLGELVASRYR